ncbi:hypothetical protein [Methylobacterium fujisawaense]|jgi:hypothetical protein
MPGTTLSVFDYVTLFSGCVLLIAAFVLAVRRHNSAVVGVFLGTGFLLIVFNLSFDVLIAKPLGIEIRKSLRQELASKLPEIERALSDLREEIKAMKLDAGLLPRGPADTKVADIASGSSATENCASKNEKLRNSNYRVLVFYATRRRPDAESIVGRLLECGFRAAALTNDDNFFEYTDVVARGDRKAGNTIIGRGDDSALTVLGSVDQIVRNALPEDRRGAVKPQDSQWTDINGSDIHVLLY